MSEHAFPSRLGTDSSILCNVRGRIPASGPGIQSATDCGEFGRFRFLSSFGFLSLLRRGRSLAQKDESQENSLRTHDVHEKKHVSEEVGSSAGLLRDAKRFAIKCLPKLIVGYEKGRQHCKNEGISHDVNENKGACSSTFGITQDVYEK